jgi:3-ketosteroid 9alpha-monooxygenase subunit B
MRTFEALVREVVQETADTVTLVLDADIPRDYLAGQFVNVDPHAIAATCDRARELEALKGKKERARPLSLASAPHEQFLALTVKEEPAGQFPSLLSPYLVKGIQPGDRLPCAGYAGLYTLPEELPTGAHLVHLCAGSGIVPNFGMIKDALHRDLPVRQTLLYSNRSWSDVIFRRELVALAHAHPERLTVVHALTRHPHGAEAPVRQERIGEAMIREHVPSLDDAWFFVCGPSVPAYARAAARARGEHPTPRFLECMKALLLGMGVQKQRISAEGW